MKENLQCIVTERGSEIINICIGCREDVDYLLNQLVRRDLKKLNAVIESDEYIMYDCVSVHHSMSMTQHEFRLYYNSSKNVFHKLMAVLTLAHLYDCEITFKWEEAHE